MDSSPIIGNLSSLKILYLCSNALTGPIPGSFSGLTKLQYLSVYMNLLSGQIPPCIATLSKLKWFDLGNNKFHGIIPAELGNLSFLQLLALSANALSGSIPCSPAKLAHLRILYVAQNKLTGNVALCLSNLTSLTELDFSENSLYGLLPASLSRLHNLEILALGANSFEGSIPESFLNFSSLKQLNLAMNKLQGSVPSWIGNFQQLQELNLNYNKFTGNMPSFCQDATELQELHQRGNSMTGSIPLCFAKLRKLSVLNVAGNYFVSGTGTSNLFTVLSNLSELTVLDISANLISGRLHSNIGNFWPKFANLAVSDNFISGKIPESMGNFSSLVELDLANNFLGGPIPPELAKMQSIQGLGLHRNRLHGKIPKEISSMNRTLAYAYLSRNRLSGSIPITIGELANLRELYLGRNLLTGKIPGELGNCELLESLDLSENQLSGRIPPEVAGLRNIIFYFDLSNNLLSGQVPADIQGLQRAQYINLFSNQLSGTIGLYMNNWLEAKQVNLSFNNFKGGLPSSIGNQIRQLQSMDLSHNSFTGSVPDSFFNLSSLRYLNLSYNFFSGEIPCTVLVHRQRRLNNFSFTANPNLCGNCVGLPVCPSSVSHRKKSHSQRKRKILKTLLIGISVTSLFLLLCLLVVVHFRKAKLSGGLPVRLQNLFLKISSEELHRATENFSSTNLVGEGRHGKVYKGVLSSGLAVAVKCFSRTEENKCDKDFRKECHVLQKIRHRNIVKIITALWSDDLKAIVMPYMNNGNLHSLLHCRDDDGSFSPIDLVTRLQILRAIASALSYLHHDCTPQVIHCDIKPENVLLDADWTAKLSDFGIARLTGTFDPAASTSSSAVKGSIGYIAPEYGTGAEVTEKGDVYSFGVVTLEMIIRLKPTDEMFSEDLTLPKLVFMAFEESTPQQRRQRVHEILKMGHANGEGIDMEDEEEIKTVECILLVGLRCTFECASMRPTMKEVESMLASIPVIGDVTNQKTLPGSLDQVLEMVQSQPPLLPGNRANRNSSSSTL